MVLKNVLHYHVEFTFAVDQFYGDVQALGGNRWDTSSLIARLHKF